VVPPLHPPTPQLGVANLVMANLVVANLVVANLVVANLVVANLVATWCDHLSPIIVQFPDTVHSCMRYRYSEHILSCQLFALVPAGHRACNLVI
jgi:multisubunit Na+/H+ antiporter MnhE subunit